MTSIRVRQTRGSSLRYGTKIGSLGTQVLGTRGYTQLQSIILPQESLHCVNDRPAGNEIPAPLKGHTQ